MYRKSKEVGLGSDTTISNGWFISSEKSLESRERGINQQELARVSSPRGGAGEGLIL